MNIRETVEARRYAGVTARLNIRYRLARAGASPRPARRRPFESDGFPARRRRSLAPHSERMRDDLLGSRRNFAAGLIAAGPRAEEPQLKRDLRLPHNRNYRRKQ